MKLVSIWLSFLVFLVQASSPINSTDELLREAFERRSVFGKKDRNYRKLSVCEQKNEKFVRRFNDVNNDGFETKGTMLRVSNKNGGDIFVAFT
jgi:hypothetical protein